MNAYDIMHEWDRVVGNEPRSDEDLDRDVPALLEGADYEDWKMLLEKGNVPAIKKGMALWGLPAEPLKPFELDEAIETHERPYSPD